MVKVLLSLFRDIHVYSVLSVFELLPKLLYMYKLKNKLAKRNYSILSKYLNTVDVDYMKVCVCVSFNFTMFAIGYVQYLIQGLDSYRTKHIF